MANFLSFLIPQDKKFFQLFERSSINLLETSKALVEMVNASSADKRKELIREIERLEHVGDAITHETFNELSTNFITPFDREDIHDMVSSLDDVVDFIHGSAKRIDLYKLRQIPPSMCKLADLVLQGAQELHTAVSNLKDIKKPDVIRAACVKINSIENHADDIFDMAIAQLFDEEKDAVQLIKTKEILSALETATDKCEDAANAISSMVVKYS
jgi:predicted phosphate transport protein (TIGR00153 family)